MDAVWRAATPVCKLPRPLRMPAPTEVAAATADAAAALGEPDAVTSPAPLAAASRLETDLCTGAAELLAPCSFVKVLLSYCTHDILGRIAITRLGQRVLF